jgi:hypothetical protein
MERRDRLVQGHRHDPYFINAKYPNPAVCQECGVVYEDGVFAWRKHPPRDAGSIVCPACRRAQDDYEGGRVHLSGSFLTEHATDIRNLIENTEDREMSERPLERILDLNEEEDSWLVRTTYEHLARRIAEAVHRAYQGELNLQYPSEDKYVRATWHRDQ